MKLSRNFNESRRQASASRSRQKRPAIILVGFMGAGKTTVAEALGQKLDCSFVDLDHAIETREGRAIASIIDADGEPRFRAIESEALRDLLEKKETRVIALGGGAWTIEENRKLIKEHDCLTVWLDAPFDLCWSRITSAGDTRPLARNKEKAEKLYEARRAEYQLADVKIKVDDKKPVDNLIGEILSLSGGKPPFPT